MPSSRPSIMRSIPNCRRQPTGLMAWILSLALLAGLAPPLLAEDAAHACEIVGAALPLDGGDLHYSRAGEGPAILLLHGLFAQKEQWHEMLCLLAAAGHAAIAPDLPGYGQSRGFPLPDHGLEAQVERLEEFVQALGLQRFDLAGNSMGGAIAALYARQHPGQVRTLAFIGAPFGIVDWGPEVRAAIHEGVNPFIPLDESELDLELSLLFVNPPDLPDEVRAALIADVVAHERQYRQIWDIVGLHDRVLERRAPNRIPTLILWGREDRIFAAAEGFGRLAHRYPRGRRILPEGMGHLPHLEQAAVTAAWYLEFLDKPAAGRFRATPGR